MIEMARDARESKGRDIFACSNALWVLLQDLGRAFGWEPLGTTYVTSGKQLITVSARHDYHPGDASDCKQVGAADAMAWARALDAAQQSAQFADLLVEHGDCNSAEGGTDAKTLHSLIYEFTAFSFGGAFTFLEVASAAGERLTSLADPRDSFAKPTDAAQE